MKYIVLFIMFVAVNANAQKCNYLVNKVSGMDSSRLIITEPYSLSAKFGDGNVNVWSTIYGDTSLVVAFVFKSKDQLLLNKGDSIFLSLDNDEILPLILIQNAVSKVDGKNNVLTALTTVDNETIELLQKHLVAEIMVNFGEMSINGAADKKNQPEAVQTVINCVVRYLQ